MTTFYTVVSWLVILGYWVLIAGVTLRILMKRRAVPSAMAQLLIIYILPLVGIIAYLSVGELHLGKRRAERARAMWPSTAKWLNDLKACKHIFAQENSSVASSLFKLCERRQGIAGVKGNQLQYLPTPMMSCRRLFAISNWRGIISKWCFTSGSQAAWRIRSLNR